MVPAARRLGAVLLVIAGPAVAASTIPEIVVTPNYAPTPLGEVGSSVTVLDDRKIAAASPASAADILRTVPGVTVIESGGPGGSTEVRLRGAETGHTVVLIDGVRVNDPASARGDFDFVTLSLNDIARVEVLRGPQSAIYGSDAMGGVINIITRKQVKKSSLTASVEGGSYGTLSERGAGGMSSGDFTLRFSGSHISSDGFSRRGDRDNDEPDGFDKTGGSLRLTYTPPEGPSIDAGVSGAYELSDYDSAGSGGQNAANTAERRLVSGFARVMLPTWNDWLDQSLTAFGTASGRTNREPAYVALPLSKYGSTDFGAEYQAIADLAAAGKLTAGFRLEQEHAENEAAVTTGFPGFVSDRTYYAAYAEHQIDVARNLHLGVSGRYDGQVDGVGFLTGRATAAYEIPGWGTTLRTSIGTGAKRPTAYQVGNNIFALTSFPQSNTNLQPEHSIGYDFGVEQTLFGGDVHVSATLFSNRFRDLLTFVTTDGATGYYDNIDRAESHGLEFAIDTVILPDVLRAGVTYTWMPTENLGTGRPLPRRPENSGSFTVTFTPEKEWELALTGTYVGERTNLASSSTMLPAYWRVDASASYALSDSVKVFGRVENMFDAKYTDPSGYNAAGFSAYVGLTWNK